MKHDEVSFAKIRGPETVFLRISRIKLLAKIKWFIL